MNSKYSSYYDPHHGNDDRDLIDAAGRMFDERFPTLAANADRQHPNPRHDLLIQLHADQESTAGLASVMGVSWGDDHKAWMPLHYAFSERPLVIVGKTGAGKSISVARHFRRSYIRPIAGRLHADEVYQRNPVFTAPRFFERLSAAKDGRALSKLVDLFGDAQAHPWLYIDDFEAVAVSPRIGAAFIDILDQRIGDRDDDPRFTVFATSSDSVEFGKQFGKLAGKVTERLARCYPVNMSNPVPDTLESGLPARYAQTEGAVLE
jgi:hypothetical protein